MLRQNQKTTVLVLNVARIEYATSWIWFLERIVSAMKGMLAIISDGAKWIFEIGVQMTLHALQIVYVRCRMHLIRNNLKTPYSSGVRFSVQSFVRENARER